MYHILLLQYIHWTPGRNIFSGFHVSTSGIYSGEHAQQKKTPATPWELRYLLKNDGWKMTFLFEMVSFQQTFHFLWGYPTLLDWLANTGFPFFIGRFDKNPRKETRDVWAILLMEEILHQLIWRNYHYLEGFYTSQVVPNLFHQQYDTKQFFWGVDNSPSTLGLTNEVDTSARRRGFDPSLMWDLVRYDKVMSHRGISVCVSFFLEMTNKGFLGC